MPDGFADWNRLGLHWVQRLLRQVTMARGLNQLPDQGSHQMQTIEPLFVGAQRRKGAGVVVRHEQVRPLERRAIERALQQRNPNDFRIHEGGRGTALGERRH